MISAVNIIHKFYYNIPIGDDTIKEKINFTLPKQHKLVMQYRRDDKVVYVVTQHIMNCMYTLFLVGEDNKLTKIKTASKPTSFKEVYPFKN